MGQDKHPYIACYTDVICQGCFYKNIECFLSVSMSSLPGTSLSRSATDSQISFRLGLWWAKGTKDILGYFKWSVESTGMPTVCYFLQLYGGKMY